MPFQFPHALCVLLLLGHGQVWIQIITSHVFVQSLVHIVFHPSWRYLLSAINLVQGDNSIQLKDGFPNKTILGQKRYACAFWHPFHLREKFYKRNYGFRLQNQYKSRYIAVRSEVAGTDSAGAAYPFSEIQFISRIRGILFYAITSFVAIFLFVLMVAAHPFVLLFDRYRRKTHHLIAKMWSVLTVSPFFAIEFEGLENLPPPDTPAIYVSNHQSFLDIYTLLTLGRSFKFISKTSIFLFPVIGWAMYFLGTIPLKRMDSRSQMECLKRCMDLVNKGVSVFFFPEGTRSKDGKLGAFKKGAFSIAAKTRVPIVPITLMGTGKIMPAGVEGRLNTGSVKVVIHKPIEGNDANLLCSEARNKVADTLVHEGYQM